MKDGVSQEAETRFGPAWLTACDGYVWFEAGRDGGGLVVNRVGYSVTAWVFPRTDGTWGIGPEGERWWQHLVVARAKWTRYRDAHPSDSAMAKLCEEIERVVTEWASANAPLLAVAAVDAARTALAAKDGELARVRAEARKVMRDRAAARRRVAAAEKRAARLGAGEVR